VPAPFVVWDSWRWPVACHRAMDKGLGFVASASVIDGIAGQAVFVHPGD
jgi:hypothetical protein